MMMSPSISFRMLRDLEEAVASAVAKAEVLNLHMTAERIRANNAGDNVALEDVVAELMRHASRHGLTMELSKDWC